MTKELEKRKGRIKNKNRMHLYIILLLECVGLLYNCNHLQAHVLMTRITFVLIHSQIITFTYASYQQ